LHQLLTTALPTKLGATLLFGVLHPPLTLRPTSIAWRSISGCRNGAAKTSSFPLCPDHRPGPTLLRNSPTTFRSTWDRRSMKYSRPYRWSSYTSAGEHACVHRLDHCTQSKDLGTLQRLFVSFFAAHPSFAGYPSAANDLAIRKKLANNSTVPNELSVESGW